MIAQDTTKVYFNYYELKSIAKNLTELKYIRKDIQLKDSLIAAQDTLIKTLHNKIDISTEINKQLNNKISIYENYLDELKNSWYDKFIYGFISGIILYYLIER